MSEMQTGDERGDQEPWPARRKRLAWYLRDMANHIESDPSVSDAVIEFRHDPRTLDPAKGECPDDGVMYRVPGRATVTLRYDPSDEAVQEAITMVLG